MIRRLPQVINAISRTCGYPAGPFPHEGRPNTSALAAESARSTFVPSQAISSNPNACDHGRTRRGRSPAKRRNSSSNGADPSRRRRFVNTVDDGRIHEESGRSVQRWQDLADFGLYQLTISHLPQQDEKS
jgi:hypothetical protein